MNALVMDLIRDLGTNECIAEMEAKVQEETVTVETLTNEAPRRTGMSGYINPDEAYDTFPVVKALKSMDDEALRRRLRFILDGGCASVRDVDGRLYQYSILITRERLARRLDV